MSDRPSPAEIQQRMTTAQNHIEIRQTAVKKLQARLYAIENNIDVDLESSQYTIDPLLIMQGEADLNTIEGLNSEIESQKRQIDLRSTNLADLNKAYVDLQKESLGLASPKSSGSTIEAPNPLVISACVIGAIMLIVLIGFLIYKYKYKKSKKNQFLPQFNKSNSYATSKISESSSRDVFRTSSTYYAPTIETGTPKPILITQFPSRESNTTLMTGSQI